MPHEDFILAWNFINNDIPTKDIDGFENGTGYMNKGVEYDTGLEVGCNAKGISSGGRRVILHVTDKGNIVIFERYNGGERGVLVWNTPCDSVLNVIFDRVGICLEHIGLMTINMKNGEECPRYILHHNQSNTIGVQFQKWSNRSK